MAKHEKPKPEKPDKSEPAPSKIYHPQHQGEDGNETKPGVDPQHGSKVPRHDKPKGR